MVEDIDKDLENFKFTLLYISAIIEDVFSIIYYVKNRDNCI
jgi:hypothetical protein